MTSRRALLLGIAGVAVCSSGLPALAQLLKNKNEINSTPVLATDKGGRVIILRGLYNVFSRGMDSLWRRLNDLGVQTTLDNHASWRRIADKLITQYKTEKDVAPIILIGHSLGADASLVMANWLTLNRVPVRLIVTFDGVAVTHPVKGTVGEIINFYKPKGYGRRVETGKGFNGTLNNVDLTDRRDIDHLNIDKDPVLQEEIIAKVLEILKVKPPKKAAVPKAQGASNPQPTPKPQVRPKTATSG